MRRPISTIFTILAILTTMNGCRWCREHCSSCKEGPPPPPRTGPGTFIDDPVPSRGSRIPPPSQPLPPPAVPDSRSSYRMESDLPPFEPVTPAGPRPDTEKKTEVLYPENPPVSKAPLENPKPKSANILEEPTKPVNSSDLPPRDDTRMNPTPTRIPPSTSAKIEAQPIPRIAPMPEAQKLDSKPEAKPDSKPENKALGTPIPRAATGLPHYVQVAGHEGLAAGGKPSLEGFDLLKANGFKTIIYIHAPEADVSAARTVAENHGLKFVPITAGGDTRSYDDFAAALSDGGKPIYVADEDGRRANKLWVQYFQKVDLLNEDEAKLRASPLGGRN